MINEAATPLQKNSPGDVGRSDAPPNAPQPARKRHCDRLPMLKELRPDQFERVRALFAPFDYSLSLEAAIRGNNPGRIFVDDILQPRTAFALTVEGYLLGGVYDNPQTNRALRQLLEQRIFTGEVYINGDWSMSLAVHPQAWEIRLAELVPTHKAEKFERYHYLCKQARFDWRSALPSNYRVQRLDRELLERVSFPPSMDDWFDADQMWGSMENFLEKGISYCLLQGDQVVSWCSADCAAGERIDVGIITHPDHRRRGLATIVTAATVEACLRRGFRAVGWHCNAENTGSWKTAEKVGFLRQRTYDYYYYIYDPIDHMAELGWGAYRRGDYARTVACYKQVFAQRQQNPDYYYHLAASACALLGEAQPALDYLHAAVDAGWSNAEFTRAQEEFQLLHELPGWREALERMAAVGGEREENYG